MCLIQFVPCTLSPILAHGMLEMLAPGQEAHKAGSRSAGVSSIKSLLQCTDLGFSLVTMMGNPDPGNTDHHQLQKMQFNPKNVYRTHTLCIGQEMKTRPLSSRSLLSNGGRRQTYASLAANRF